MNYYNPGHYNYFHQREATKYGPTVLPQTPQTMQPPMKPMSAVKPSVNLPPRFLTPEEGWKRGNLDANAYDPYEPYVPKTPIPKTEKEALMQRIQAYSFACLELGLYLDTHPNDRNVLEMFLRYREELRKMTMDYQNRFEPISFQTAPLNKLPWQWAATDWPWERM